MAVNRAVRYSDAPAFVRSPLEQAPCHMVTSLRVAFRYGTEIPTVAQLQRDFGMHRASAYRWRRSYRDALEAERGQ